jgi:molecular chaperone DnaK
MDRVRDLTSELQQVLAGLSAVSAGAGASVGADAGGTTSEADDDVIDAEFDRS